MRAVRKAGLAVLALGCLCVGSASAAEKFGDAAPSRPVATYSIVAMDEHTGEIGVAVQSHWFSVGSVVTWAEAGVGAVATQAFVEPSYGPEGLDLMRKGKPADKALDALLKKDRNDSIRQVAFVDASGAVSAYTGKNVIGYACDAQGYGFSVQANLMESDEVCNAMAAQFEHSTGDLATRLIQALETADALGGDLRGKRSAAIVVVKAKRQDNPWEGHTIDLRVEDNPQPLKELKRLVVLNQAYNKMAEADAYLARGNVKRANEIYTEASALVPENNEFIFWRAVTLASAGHVDDALPYFKQAFEAWPAWKKLIPRLPASVVLPDDPDLIARILAVDPTTDDNGDAKEESDQ